MRVWPIASGALLLVAVSCRAQDLEKERTFSQPVSVVQAAVNKLPGGTSGPLPILEGFVVAGSRELDRYQRPYYHCAVQVTAAASGGSLVRVNAKVTAWQVGPHPGYKTLESNGRVESDLLERLQNFLVGQPPSSGTTSDSGDPSVVPNHPPPDTSMISAPTQPFPKHSGLQLPTSDNNAQASNSALALEAKNLDEILHNQSHPTNLVAIKQNQTPVVQNSSVDAKVLFLASAEDEFEVIESNPDWVHVRISGLSRGWIRLSMVEFIDGSRSATTSSASTSENAGAGHSQSTAPFSISSEETGNFPGAWPALSGKNVRIISVQQTAGTGRISSPENKRHFARTVFESESDSLPQSVAGLVVIFDAEDGGMVAATRTLIAQWKKGSLSEQAFWQQCFRDPPAILGGTN